MEGLLQTILNIAPMLASVPEGGEIAEGGTHATTTLVVDLGIVLVSAAVIMLLFRKFQLPVFLGYILAGLLIGPNLFGLVSAPGTISQLSELGVVFLMFYIGMEFDLEKLKRVLGPALLALILQASAFLIIGLQIAPLLDKSAVEGIFLGALLAISSSMVSIAILRDLHRLDKPHAQLVVGILILEDILAIALLVILSGVAASGMVDLQQVFQVTFLIAAFVVGIFIVGRMLAHRLLDHLERAGDREIMAICAVALMLGVAVLAAMFDLSVALGSFVAGAMLSQTKLSHEIEETTQPLRDIFCAVFFVSVGMMINLASMLDLWLSILILSLITFLIKISTVWVGLFMAGENPDTSWRAAVTKAQIGEFSFIIAFLATSLGVADDRMLSLAIGVAVLTTIGSLTMAKNSDPLYEKVHRMTPKMLRTLGAFYLNFFESVRVRLGRSTVLKLIRRPLLQTAIAFFLLAAIVIAVYFVNNYVDRTVGEHSTMLIAKSVTWLAGIICSLPLVSSLVRHLNAIVMLITEALFTDSEVGRYQQSRVANIFRAVIQVLVFLVAALLFLGAAAFYLPPGPSLALLVGIVGVAAFFLWNRIIRLNSHLEFLFMESFNQRVHQVDSAARQKAVEEIQRKYPWPVNVRNVTLPRFSHATGRTLRELRLREETGTMIVAIGRHGGIKYDPHPSTVLFPEDHVYLFGETEQTDAAAKLLENERPADESEFQEPSFRIEAVYLDLEHWLIDQTLASAHLRSDYGVSVLGIQRGNKRITVPSPQEIIEAGDVLYVVGNTESIELLKENRKPEKPPAEGELVVK